MTSQFSIRILNEYLHEKGYSSTLELTPEDQEEVLKRVRERTIEWLEEVP